MSVNLCGYGVFGSGCELYVGWGVWQWVLLFVGVGYVQCV